MALKQPQIEAIKNYYSKGYSQCEIAKLVGVTEKTVSKRLIKIKEEIELETRRIENKYNKIVPVKQELQKATTALDNFSTLFKDTLAYLTQEAKKVTAKEHGRELIYFITEMAKLSHSNKTKKAK